MKKTIESIAQQKKKFVGTKGKLKVNDNKLLEDCPFSPMKQVPIEVFFETPYFLVCKVLPHKNSGPMSCGISKEYTITVDKFNLATKRMEIIPT